MKPQLTLKMRRAKSVDKELERIKQRLGRQAMLLKSGITSVRVNWLLEKEGLGKTTGQPQEKEIVEAWAAVAVLDAVARYSGAPYAWGCESLAAALNELLTLRKRRRVLLAGPTASMTLVAALPLFALLLGQLSGFNPVGLLLSPAGSPLLLGGVLLICLGVLWLRYLISSTANDHRLQGFECELLALALRGGLPLSRALKLVCDEILRSGSRWLVTDALAESGAAGKAARAVAVTGAGVTQVLLEAAAAERRLAAEGLETAAEKLGSKALLPLACCILPAFLVLGVIPFALALFQGI